MNSLLIGINRQILVLVIPFFILAISNTRSKYVKTYQKSEGTVTQQWVMLLEKNFSIKFPRVVYCQMILETRYFTSHIFLTSRNGFGMKKNYRPFNLANPKQVNPSWCSDNTHACYDELYYSIEDYASWQRTRFDQFLDCQNNHPNKMLINKFGKELPRTDEEYIKFLGMYVIDTSECEPKRYAVDRLYETKLTILLNKTIPLKLGTF